MLDRYMRAVKESVLYPVAELVGGTITPTQITFAGGLIGMMAALSAWQGCYVVGLSLWLLNRVFDGLDGTVARKFDKQSDLGAYIDILVDFLIYALVAIGLAVSVGTTVVYLTLIFMLASFYVNSASWMYLSSILEKRNLGAKTYSEMTSVTMPTGLIEGTETILFYALFFILPQFLSALFIIVTALIIVTIFQRLYWAFQHLD